MGFWSEEDGQVSAEMLIVIAAMVALALLLVSQLQETAAKGKSVLVKESAELFKEIEKIK
ncbi:hypothetical protein HZC09_04980 [Candidatus Micrarchaeota archaeon]|nr:hypothetical protein [Candidatus Micrarchaeota archaeon]